jgi:dTDP-4-amino-4,6-dideoxygalactose transaminase
MNELQAAFGLLQLDNFEDQISKRKEITGHYRELLKNTKGLRVLDDMQNIKHNYSYFPVFISKDYPLTRDELYQKLRDNNIYGRRYFYPLISDFPTYRGLPSAQHSNLSTAVKTADEVICLPIYPELTIEELKYVVKIINNV